MVSKSQLLGFCHCDNFRVQLCVHSLDKRAHCSWSNKVVFLQITGANTGLGWGWTTSKTLMKSSYDWICDQFWQYPAHILDLAFSSSSDHSKSNPQTMWYASVFKNLTYRGFFQIFRMQRLYSKQNSVNNIFIIAFDECYRVSKVIIKLIVIWVAFFANNNAWWA